MMANFSAFNASSWAMGTHAILGICKPSRLGAIPGAWEEEEDALV